MIWALLKMIPSSVYIGLAAALAAIAALWAVDHNGYKRGAESVRIEWAKERQAYILALEKEKTRQAGVVEKVTVQYRDRIKVVKEAGIEIVKQVPVFIRGGCNLPGGWRVLHDAAASGSVPEDLPGAVSAAQPVEGAAALETVAANYASCQADQTRLIALQQLIAGVSK